MSPRGQSSVTKKEKYKPCRALLNETRSDLVRLKRVWDAVARVRFHVDAWRQGGLLELDLADAIDRNHKLDRFVSHSKLKSRFVSRQSVGQRRAPETVLPGQVPELYIVCLILRCYSLLTRLTLFIPVCARVCQLAQKLPRKVVKGWSCYQGACADVKALSVALPLALAVRAAPFRDRHWRFLAAACHVHFTDGHTPPPFPHVRLGALLDFHVQR
jgi:hypothetical protein